MMKVIAPLVPTLMSSRYRSTQSRRSQLEELSPERFREVVALVQERKQDPQARKALKEDEDIAPAWNHMTNGWESAVTAMGTALEQAEDVDEYKKADFTSPRSYKGTRVAPGRSEGVFSPHLALFIGELKRVMALSDQELDQEQLTSQTLPDYIKNNLEEEQHLEALFPLAATAPHVIRLPNRGEEEPGLPLDLALETTEALGKLQERMGVRKQKNKIVRKNVRSTQVPKAGARLADPNFLEHDELPEAFQETYKKGWNVGYATTRTPEGAFVRELRERVQKEGPSEILVVMAASSDGTDREVAGISHHTPEKVYKKMIYDNAQHVLNAVVQNRRFNDQLAYAMMETDLPKQLTAVMLHGRVDMGVRVLACRKALANEGVDPVDIFNFLRGHSRHPDVPGALWRDFIEEVNRRLHAIQVQGEEEDVEQYRQRLERLSKLAVDEVVRPYWELARDLRKAKNKVAQQEENATRYGGRWARRRKEKAEKEHREFVEKHEMIQDPEFLDILVEGADEKRLLNLLKYCVESDLPVTKKMTVAVLQHDSPELRQEAMRLLPNVDEQEVEEMAQELEEKVAQDFEAVRQQVEDTVLPEYEPVHGKARHRNARKWPHFPAARTHSLEELIETYVHCYETDPQNMFQEFSRLTRRPRMASRVEEELDGSPRMEASPLDTEPVTQAELFGEEEGMGSAGRPTNMETDSPENEGNNQKRKP